MCLADCNDYLLKEVRTVPFRFSILYCVNISFQKGLLINELIHLQTPQDFIVEVEIVSLEILNQKKMEYMNEQGRK